MKSVIMKSKYKTAFTIVELLTVMSVIVILIGLLVPALNQVKRFAYEVKQKAQLKSIDTALELFNTQFEEYPQSSNSTDSDGNTYCGAMKLAEAMVGKDLQGFHPESSFSGDDSDLYIPETKSSRKDVYLPLENANAYRMGDVYGSGNLSKTMGGTSIKFDPDDFVLCDVFRRVENKGTAGGMIGMPILYYRANTAKSSHEYGNADNIYDYMDNHYLAGLGMPFDTGEHPLFQEHDSDGNPVGQPGERFYWNTQNEQVTVTDVPYKDTSFILITAGNDGEYGTPDDISNFDWRYRRRQ